jgi:hypothetical protein
MVRGNGRLVEMMFLHGYRLSVSELGCFGVWELFIGRVSVSSLWLGREGWVCLSVYEWKAF